MSGEEVHADREAARLARKHRRRADRRHRLLELARGLLAEHGAGAFTMARLAKAADMSKPSIYYYFDSKEALGGALCLQQVDMELGAVAPRIARAQPGVDALGVFLQARIDLYVDDPTSFRAGYLWPQILGMPLELVTSELLPRAAKQNQGVEDRVRAGDDLAPGLDPRRLVNVAWMTAQGILTAATGMQGVGSSLLYPVRELARDARRVLEQGARRPQASA